MLARVFSCAVIGLEGVIVEVEVDYSNGLPAVIIVGLPDAAVQESRERVQTAVKNAGLHFPRHRIVVNLSPASIRKEGPAYDLPIALGVIILSGHLPHDVVENTLIVGELSLDGVVRHTRGILPMAATARANGYKRMFVPEADAGEAALIPDLEVFPVRTLADLYNHLSGRSLLQPYQPSSSDALEPLYTPTDFSEIKGQDHVKRALEVAAAGGHNVLMVGSPGAGKTLLARAMPGILPEMSIEESLDVTRIYSVADQLPAGTPLIRHRPFRSPHHTISHAGLVGGGNIPKPGEISLAHRGVLFLDEFPEFGSRVLEVMRQPMEDKVVTISRAKGSLTFSANFQLIAAMNPCPCGYYGDSQKPCTCAQGVVTKYQKRISGPMLDRIDIHIEVPRVDYEKLSGDRLGESSESIRARVQAARDIQQKRFANSKSDIICNADMRVGEIRQFCKLQDEGQSLMRAAMSQMNLSARAYHRILKLARTIADLAGSEDIQSVHLAEALQYRPKLMQGVG
ncbi:MAG: YifB family Mg chelatase-like AAA ATPase [Anaerolineae bacterium]|nr:YifB family Mg chelatase-like AAA ATPase [Anaerolineae bacterium]MBL8104624.1 YifB family Mg chelatase-like AAA ATPase [Anaerolineales bacterium]MCC7189582.1 YifB family Mg chelatase-like AAA ATPase [Anaerolineales bacterium]